MTESFKTRLLRWRITSQRTGARITYMAADFLEVRIRLSPNRETRNYVGTVFGGAMFGALDGVHVVMLTKVLGPDYSVWGKTATIRYKRPGRTMLYARVVLDEQELDSIRAKLFERSMLDWLFHVDWRDATDNRYASLEKTIHIRRKERQPDASPNSTQTHRRVAA